MFPGRYFAARYFAPRYFPKVGEDPVVGMGSGLSGLSGYSGMTPSDEE